MNKIEIKINDVFGMWKVIDLEGEPKISGGRKRRRVLCECECGNIVSVYPWALNSGSSQSCGCNNGVIHGNYKDRLYRNWYDMMRRTDATDASVHRTKNYAGKGISVCQEWHDFDVFKQWAIDNGWNDSKNVSIERKNTLAGYSPENCVILHERRPQAQNQTHSRWWIIDGICYDSASHASEKLGISVTKVIRLCNGRKYPNGTVKPPAHNCYSVKKYTDNVKNEKPNT